MQFDKENIYQSTTDVNIRPINESRSYVRRACVINGSSLITSGRDVELITHIDKLMRQFRQNLIHRSEISIFKGEPEVVHDKEQEYDFHKYFPLSIIELYTRANRGLQILDTEEWLNTENE